MILKSDDVESGLSITDASRPSSGSGDEEQTSDDAREDACPKAFAVVRWIFPRIRFGTFWRWPRCAPPRCHTRDGCVVEPCQRQIGFGKSSQVPDRTGPGRRLLEDMLKFTLCRRGVPAGNYFCADPERSKTRYPRRGGNCGVWGQRAACRAGFFSEFSAVFVFSIVRENAQFAGLFSRICMLLPESLRLSAWIWSKSALPRASDFRHSLLRKMRGFAGGRSA